MSTCPTRRGGTIPELLAGAAALALLAALILPAAARFRADSRTASSLSQLRWIAGVTSSYAADNADRFWSYSWKAGPLPHSDPTLPASASTDVNAAAVQAIDILRRRADPELPAPAVWIPHPNYTHLPLADYLDLAPPQLDFIAPADGVRRGWIEDPSTAPAEPGSRLRYGASYEISAAFWDRSRVGDRIAQSDTHRSYMSSFASQLGGVRISETLYPSLKIFVHDKEQRLAPPRQFGLVAGSRIATLCVDGAAVMFAAQNANAGWQPNAPESPGPSHFDYRPTVYDAPTTTGEPREPVVGRHRWTRGGIEGRDFGGPEVDTGQP